MPEKGAGPREPDAMIGHQEVASALPLGDGITETPAAASP